MLQSLHIKNFKNLEDLKIHTLERVNLITGKNNTGKSTVLEALELYNSFGRFDVLLKQLEQRGILNKDKNNGYDQNFQALRQLFYNYQHHRTIKIETKQDTLTIQSANYIEETIKKGTWTEHKTTIVKENGSQKNYLSAGLLFKNNVTEELFKLYKFYTPYNEEYLKQFTPCFYLSPCFIEKDFNGNLWDKITLTDKENSVIKALKIIEPKIERIAFIEKYGERSPVIKVQGEKQVLPLKSMGDGINRILTIILALVNAEGGMLLIDEFENGLHYTVQEQLWKMIFLLSEELDIQIFATTHSEDCIRGFENVLNDYKIATNGKLIRLDKKGDKIVQVEFDREELKVATDFDIEIR